MEKIYYLAIDPGRDKFGFAVVDGEGRPIQFASVAVKQMEYSLAQLAREYSFAQILLGDGTGKNKFTNVIKEIFPQTRLSVVDEHETTLQAKALYWRLNPPSGLKKFLPVGLRTIDQPLDAYAALVIARRWLDENKPG